MGRRLLVITLMVLVCVAVSCQQGESESTPTQPATQPPPTQPSSTPAPTNTLVPTWTPSPTSPRPTPTVTLTAASTRTQPQIGPTSTRPAFCDEWWRNTAPNLEEFEGTDAPVIAWNPLPEVAYYEFRLNNPLGREIVSETVPSPEGGLIVTYTIDIDVLSDGGVGYGWEVRPIGLDGGMLCGNISGEFSYTP